MAVSLQTPRQHQLHQVSHVDARRSGIKAHIGLQLSVVEGRAQCVQVGAVGYEPTPGQFVQ